MSDERHKTARSARRIGDAYLIATILPLSILIGYGIGWGLDRLFGTNPWCTAIFTGLGVIAGFMEAIRIALRVGGEEDSAARTRRGGDDDR
ncbi:MAG: AtpZ/AtpI family protein [Acidobacteriota bacterium]